MNALAHVGPLSELERLSRGGATGEFICAAGPEEIHVYLQQGRIAWATCSAHPFEFARYIKEHGKIDDETLREVLSECRRQKLPFGETLVAWDLVGWDDIRAALRHQIRLAFDQLASLVEGQTMFLERRKFSEYNSRLTLELDSVFPARDEVVWSRPLYPDSRDCASAQIFRPAESGGDSEQNPDVATRGSALAVGSSSEIPTQATPDPAEVAPAAPQAGRPGGTGRARVVREAIRGALWAQLRDGDQLIEWAPQGSAAPQVSSALVACTLDAGADFTAIRSPRGTLIGSRVQGDGSDVWCALGADANYGIALSTLRSLGFLRGDDPRRGASLQHDERAWEIGDLRTGAGAELRLVFGGHKILAAILLGADNQPRAGVARVALDHTGWLHLLARRASIFAIPDHVLLDGVGGPDLEPLGFSIRMAVTGERGLWCFGAELPAGETLWVLTDRSTLQGIGWACLTTLIRGVALGAQAAQAAPAALAAEAAAP